MTDNAAAPFESDYIQFGIPGVPYSAVKVHITDDRNEMAARVERALKLAEWTRAKYEATFGRQAEPATVQAATNAPPRCNTHNRPMKRSEKDGGWYCSAKLADGSYCKERVAA